MTITDRTPHKHPLPVVALSLVLAMATGCGAADTPEADTDPPAARSQTPAEQVSGSPQVSASSPTAGEQATIAYTGPYDEDFTGLLPTYNGQQVSLTGEVRDLIRSRSSYELGDPADPDLDPLLISARYAVPDVAEGTRVEVTGIVREAFEPPVVEEAVEDEAQIGFYDQHRGQPYLDEARVEVLGPTYP